ncbi:response regulator transcription factor [Sanguibacter sp. A247]|uniref:response regulator transcription factor n=1 Tax=unclassified Sanguibacter TaxID=2645534 RepID=UPI003FD8D2C4
MTTTPAPRTAEPQVTVLVADDEQLLRSALAQVLDLQPGIRVVAQAADGLEAVTRAREVRPHVALLDLDMPVLDGLAATAQLRAEGIAVVVMTRHARPTFLRRALEAGAAGFVLKTTPADRLGTIVLDVHAGHRYVDPEVAALALTARTSPLSERELEVLALVRDGRSARDIAATLSLAQGTVRNYVSGAISRLGVTTGREAADIAWDEGWI